MAHVTFGFLGRWRSLGITPGPAAWAPGTTVSMVIVALKGSKSLSVGVSSLISIVVISSFTSHKELIRIRRS